MRLLLTICVLASLLIMSGVYNVYQYIEASYQEVVIVNKKVDNRPIILNYLHTFPHLSTTVANKIANAILANSREYKISPILLTAIISKESSFRSWIRHSDVVVTVPLDANATKKDTITTNAVGLTGVIWEIHKYRLIKGGILNKSDLYDIGMSIRAMCIVIDYYRSKAAIKGMSTTQSAVLRYYGLTYNKGIINTDYLQGVNSRVGDILQDSIYK